MSLISAFVDAFKKASASKTRADALEHARSDGVLGPTAGTGAFTPSRTAPGSPGIDSGAAVGGGVAPPVASSGSDNKAPEEPLPPEPGPVEGGDGPTTPKQSPLEPNVLHFPREAASGESLKVEHGIIPEGINDVSRAEAPLDSGRLNPIIPGRDRVLDDVRLADAGAADRPAGPTGLKIEDAYKVEGPDLSVASSDPQEGGEFHPEHKTNLDPGFMRRLRELGDDQPTIAGGDTPLSTESGPPEPGRRLLTAIDTDGDEAPDSGDGPHLTPGTPGGSPPEDSEGEPERLVRLLRDRDQPSGLNLRGGDAFDVKIEEVVATSGVPAAPGPVPLPYPLAADTTERLKIGLPFKTDDGETGFAGVKLHDTLTGDLRDGGGGDVSPGHGGGLADALARKAGKGQQDYLTVKMEDVIVSSRDAGDDANGGSAADHLRGETNIASRSELHDAHDRFSNLDVHDSASFDDIDDDNLEPSSLLELKPESNVTEMLPGLAGNIPDDFDLPDDLDADADGDGDDDADESEL